MAQPPDESIAIFRYLNQDPGSHEPRLVGLTSAQPLREDQIEDAQSPAAIPKTIDSPRSDKNDGPIGARPGHDQDETPQGKRAAMNSNIASMVSLEYQPEGGDVAEGVTREKGIEVTDRTISF